MTPSLLSLGHARGRRWCGLHDRLARRGVVGAPPCCFGEAACLGGDDACPCSAPCGHVEASPPEPDVASPQGEGAGGTTAAEPLEGEGGATSNGDTGGACVPPLTRLSALCAVSPCVGSPGLEGGASDRVAVPCHPDQAPGRKQPWGGPGLHLLSRFFPSDARGSYVQALGSASPGAV
jgi:hypothetical protein